MKNKNENKEESAFIIKKTSFLYSKNYKLACFMVVVCILVSALTTLCGTLFIQKLY